MSDKINGIIEKILEMTSKKGAPGLARMGKLLSLLGNPEQSFRVLHVAGTNGKGSTSRFLYNILRANGEHVGIYSSPHVMEYNERFEVDGELISDEDFCRIVERILELGEQLAREGDGYPSMFEILTAMCYEFFRERGVKYAVIEVGLGGRMDPTNTVDDPLVTVITQIGLDHTEMLGESLAEIASEKAGIIKSGVPVISSSADDEVRAVISRRAEELGAQFIDSSRYERIVKYYNAYTNFTVLIDDVEYNGLQIRLLGEHQVDNAIAAVAAIAAINRQDSAWTGLAHISTEVLRKGLEVTVNMGRFEVLASEPYLILDGAHNPCGIRAAMRTVELRFAEALRAGARLCIAFGCLSDKACDEMIDIITGCDDLPAVRAAERVYVVTEPVSERAVPAEVLGDKFEERGYSCTRVSDISEAYALTQSLGCEITIYLGSIYLIGDIRVLFEEKGWSTDV